MTDSIIHRYFDAFNGGDTESMIALVSEDVVHHVNQGETRHGRAAFTEFCSHMGVSYREELRDMVIFLSAAGDRAAAEFTVHGTYLKTDPGLPEAKGQRYMLPAGSFFTLTDGEISRITTYYNLQEWIRQVSA